MEFKLDASERRRQKNLLGQLINFALVGLKFLKLVKLSRG